MGCDSSDAFSPTPLSISIHAPIVGCDNCVRCFAIFRRYFNPRTHRGVRPFFVNVSFIVNKFQSTHPSWGATAGSLVLIQRTKLFQSTHPSWGATVMEDNFRPCRYISIHAPIVGCDLLMINLVNISRDISIHAPIVGCDTKI